MGHRDTDSPWVPLAALLIGGIAAAVRLGPPIVIPNTIDCLTRGNYLQFILAGGIALPFASSPSVP